MSEQLPRPVKKVLDPEFGIGLEALANAEGTNQLVHSKGVSYDFGPVKYVAISGLAAVDQNMKPLGVGDVREQTRIILEDMVATLKEEGGTIDDVFRVRVYVVGLDNERLRIIHEERAKVFHKDHYPASTLVEVQALILPELLVEIDCDALIVR